ncbi:hypothetical protein EDC02_6559 [Micromonospora sp. Llam0]|uniref:hypothetical protein n=1 Tax=Micromonospora sp. Llam0 TaxID=2485143 RepID=UPI000F498BFC|nr:hypothetical protein [Micromonospora sp. Llam0]ROO51674.1 hypothetical protein EDC02_6559 [Micromonospora sp. Llam0]
MRHLWSFLSGLAAAPLCWLLIAVGQTTSARTIAGWVTDGSYHTATLLAPAAFVFAAGLLLGLLGTLRFSPLGPLTAGLALAAPYVAMFVDPFGARDLIGTPWRLFGEPVVLLQPVENGTLGLLGVLLSTAVLSRQRWRSRPATNGTAADKAGSDAAAAEPLPVRPLGEFDPSLWSLPGGGTTMSDESANAPTGPDRADADWPASATKTRTTLAAPAEDVRPDGVRPDGDGLRPARPIPRSSRVIR